MKYLSTFCAVIFCSTPVFAQGSPGGIADCPVSGGQKVGNLYFYNTRNCQTGTTGSGQSTRKASQLPVPCNSNGTCSEPVTGTGNGTKPLKPIPEPKPVRDIDEDLVMFSSWQEVARAFQKRVPCASVLTIDDVARLEDMELKTSADRNAAFEKLQSTIPEFTSKFLKADSYAEQQSMLVGFSKRFRQVFEVTVPLRKGFSNVHRGFDLPMQSDIPATAKLTNPSSTKKDSVVGKDVGVVKVMDGDATYYFHLVSIPKFGGLAVHAGIQVQQPADDSKVLTGSFVGHRLWTHQIKVNGELYLVTTKDPRASSKVKK